jgi:hypothetical protein
MTQQHRQDEERLKPWIDPHQLKCLNGTWYKEGRVVVTEDLEGKRNIIKVHHDPPVHGHPGISKTIQLVERNYWWPQMRKDITDYVQGMRRLSTPQSQQPSYKGTTETHLSPTRSYAF